MRTTTWLATLALAVAAATYPAQASAHGEEPVVGALIGGGIGAAVGGPPGAAVGAFLGLAIGATAHHDHHRHHRNSRRDDRYGWRDDVPVDRPRDRVRHGSRHDRDARRGEPGRSDAKRRDYIDWRYYEDPRVIRRDERRRHHRYGER